MPIRPNLEEVQLNIEEAAKKAGRKKEDILLLGATKTVEPARIQVAVDAGLCHIGENRVQELRDKFGHVKGASWHFIGHLQTNKVKYIIDKATLIHAVDSDRLLDEIESQGEKRGIRASVLLEINASGEESKFGLAFSDVLPIIERNETRKHVEILGLMTIGPNTHDTAEIQKAYAKMYKTFDALGAQKFENSRMEYLSMGMSGDYPLAIQEGANIVRIGSAIFGYRENGGKK